MHVLAEPRPALRVRAASTPCTLTLGLIGPGRVGRALLAQLTEAAPRLAAGPRGGLHLDLRAVADSRCMRLADSGDCDDAALSTATDLDRLAAHLDGLGEAVLIDCSGADAVADHYADWLAHGLHVVTPGKQAGSGPWERYRAVRAAAQRGGQFRYEASVGAGLPVVQTLRALLDTGDTLLEVEGVLSGTLAWLFNRFDGRVPFSQLLREAASHGYTEPDPRDDLSGLDVARKLVILAREAGLALSLDDVAVENLVPAPLRTVSREEFLMRAHELDAPLHARLCEAQCRGRALRYLARLGADGGARVGLVSPEAGHASLHGRLTDNVIELRTRRYADNPLVVQGPGAGPEVTAAGVFGDVLAIAQSLGARL